MRLGAGACLCPASILHRAVWRRAPFWEGNTQQLPPGLAFLRPSSTGLFSGSEIAARRFLPKSHLSTVIIRDNTSVQRVQDIKLRHIEDSQKKVGGFFDQMKKKFVHDQQTKMTRWKKQYGHYQRMLEQIDQRAQRRLTISNIIVVEQKRSSLSGWNPTLKPERPKQRLK